MPKEKIVLLLLHKYVGPFVVMEYKIKLLIIIDKIMYLLCSTQRIFPFELHSGDGNLHCVHLL